MIKRPAWLTDRRALALLVFVASVLLYLSSVWNGYAYDDNLVIVMDTRIHSLVSAPHIFTQTYWNNPDLGLYRPITSLTLAIDWAIGRGNAHWFHFMNMLWNATAVVLVFLLLAEFAPLGAALVGALIFAVHPTHVEAVANIVGRAEVLAAVFSLAAMLIWTRSAPDEPLPRRSAAAVAALYVLAMLSKESAIMLPALLALCDMARRVLTPRGLLRWLRVHASTIALLALTAVAYLAVRYALVGGVGPKTVDPLLDVAKTTSARIFTALQAWPVIARLMFFPNVLLSDYGPNIMLPALTPSAGTIAGVFILGGLIAVGIAAWFDDRGPLAAILLFIPVALLPTANLLVPIGVIVAERTLYLPSFALAFAASLTWAALERRRVSAGARGMVLAVILVLMSARTLTRIPAWRSTETLFAALQHDRPDSFRAAWYLARVAADHHHKREALELFAQALQIWPFRRVVVIEAAGFAAEQGEYRYTEQVTTFAMKQWPNDILFFRIRAGAQLDLGDTVAARATILRGLKLAPGDTTLNKMQRAITAQAH